MSNFGEPIIANLNEGPTVDFLPLLAFIGVKSGYSVATLACTREGRKWVLYCGRKLTLNRR